MDATDGCLDELVSAVTSDRRLELVGLHYRADGVDLVELAQIILEMIYEMARIRRDHAVFLPRLSLGDVDMIDNGVGPGSLRRLAELIDEVVEEGCIRFRYPRPGLTLSPSGTTLLPAA